MTPRGQAEQQQRQEQRQQQTGGAARQPWLEWVASGLGLALALGVIGVILWEGLRSEDGPPAVVVQVECVVATAAGYVVEFRAVNRGEATAAKLQVQGELKRGGETIETGEVSFDYIPGHSERRGGLVFSQDPRPPLTLELRATGYAEP